jgi:hypothetical protein
MNSSSKAVVLLLALVVVVVQDSRHGVVVVAVSCKCNVGRVKKGDGAGGDDDEQISSCSTSIVDCELKSRRRRWTAVEQGVTNIFRFCDDEENEESMIQSCSYNGKEESDELYDGMFGS